MQVVLLNAESGASLRSLLGDIGKAQGLAQRERAKKSSCHDGTGLLKKSVNYKARDLGTIF